MYKQNLFITGFLPLYELIYSKMLCLNNFLFELINELKTMSYEILFLPFYNYKRYEENITYLRSVFKWDNICPT